jgi:ribosome biogenesis protein MAK21
MQALPSLRSLLEQPEEQDADDEHYDDAPESDDEAAAPKPAAASANGTATATAAYNAQHRDPRFCGAERSCLWELIPVRF